MTTQVYKSFSKENDHYGSLGTVYKTTFLNFKNIYNIPRIGVKRFIKNELKSIEESRFGGIKIWFINKRSANVVNKSEGFIHSKERIVTRRIRNYLRRKDYVLNWGSSVGNRFMVIYKNP